MCSECGEWHVDGYSPKLVLEKVPNFKAAKTTANTVRLEWQEPFYADGFIVYRYNRSTKKLSRIARVKGTSYVDTELTPGTTYKYAVKAYVLDEGTEVLSSTYPTVVTSTNPATVNFTLTAGSKKAVAKWTKTTGATGYKVYYKASANGKWIGLTTTKGTSYTKAGLAKGKTYYFTVRAYRTVNGKTYNGAFVTKSVKVK